MFGGRSAFAEHLSIGRCSWFASERRRYMLLIGLRPRIEPQFRLRDYHEASPISMISPCRRCVGCGYEARQGHASRNRADTRDLEACDTVSVLADLR